MRKIKIPSKEQRRIKKLESENADLWFRVMNNQTLDGSQNEEIADLWFEFMNMKSL